MTTRSEKFEPVVGADHAGTLERLLRQVREWAREESLRRQLREERRQLLYLSDAMLDDLGISREEAKAEARRTDVPAERMMQLRRDRRG
ncbi:MAG: DUF1127 domain-containing protein [Gammaproteobacteria bacterium]|jgi:uncharacterized protein YjiS (DUF1127 family)